MNRRVLAVNGILSKCALQCQTVFACKDLVKDWLHLTQKEVQSKKNGSSRSGLVLTV